MAGDPSQGEPKIRLDVHASRPSRLALRQGLARRAHELGLGEGWAIRLSDALVYQQPEEATWAWRIRLRAPSGRSSEAVLLPDEQSLRALLLALGEIARSFGAQGAEFARGTTPGRRQKVS